MLVIKEGVVRLSSPNNFVTLTPNRWEEINEEMKAFIHMSRSVSYRVHIGDEYYVTINNSTCRGHKLIFDFIIRSILCACIFYGRECLFVLMNGLISQHCYHLSTNVNRN